jgi:LAS superfamily LD-carboxypeptidase LdcB
VTTPAPALRRGRLIVAAVVVSLASSVGVVASIASPAYAVNAIQPANRPTPLPGEANGLVDPVSLLTVEGDCRLARDAAPSFVHLLAAARADGINLGTESCYRPLADQIAVRGNACGNGNCACAASISSTATVGTSYHGWGKAVDFTVDGQSLTDPFSAAERWLNAHAGAYGWNHPAFALLGTACPEAWHWEWVGDGGILHGTPIRADVMAGVGPDGGSLAMVTGRGAVRWISGPLAPAGQLPILPLWSVIVGGAVTPSGRGLWRVGGDGGVFSSGDARFFGSTGALHLNRPIVGMAAGPAGHGYWLVASDGGIFSFGSARFHGSTGAMRLNRSIVGMAATPGRNGYWLVASDGGIFSFGSARFHGSTGAIHLNSPIVGMAATPSGNGYWLVASDGGVFSFGDAVFHGSAAGSGAAPIVGIVRSAGGNGYSLFAADRTVLPFGS